MSDVQQTVTSFRRRILRQGKASALYLSGADVRHYGAIPMSKPASAKDATCEACGATEDVVRRGRDVLCRDPMACNARYDGTVVIGDESDAEASFGMSSPWEKADGSR